jgi:hypothetical protein
MGVSLVGCKYMEWKFWWGVCFSVFICCLWRHLFHITGLFECIVLLWIGILIIQHHKIQFYPRSEYEVKVWFIFVDFDLFIMSCGLISRYHCSSKALVFMYESTWYCAPEDQLRHLRHLENLKSHIMVHICVTFLKVIKLLEKKESEMSIA